ncbi:hypothetical protein SAMN04487939_11654 [Lysobacter sp. yr284]|uniref:hypothetical protein n=1 Tax=Lysobacter TaxID=68 RepID=UPI0008989EB3|nr:hypothetical protein [Lysobacter sp. yr284]SDZ11025.1 hypothetical protein SAMN04487939_11654 [Lysobacter sp. yr284]
MRVKRIIGLAFAISLVLPACSFAKEPGPAQGLVKESVTGKRQGPTYPASLIGQWEPGPNPCKLPLAYDSDGGFKIAARMLQGYEHSDTPKRVQLISDTPKAWRIEAIEEHDGDKNPVVDIYVLSGDYLTVTDGERSTTYNRCH